MGSGLVADITITVGILFYTSIAQCWCDEDNGHFRSDLILSGGHVDQMDGYACHVLHEL